MFQHFRAVADYGRAFDGILQFAVFHPPRFRRAEHEFAAGNVHLTAAEIDGVNAFIERGDDFFGVVAAVFHKGVGHARHGGGGVAFAAAVAGGLHAHQSGVGFVLHIADQNAVFNEYGTAGFVAFVVDIERTATVGYIALVNDGNAFGGHPLSDFSGKRAGLLAVEIAFQAVPDGFVQQYARPAAAQNDFHQPCRRGARFEIGQCLLHGGVYIFRY